LLDDRTIAGGLVLTSGRSAWYWLTTYDEAFAPASPGLQLTLGLSEALEADTGLDFVDSGAVPDHPIMNWVWPDRLAVAGFIVRVRPDADTAFEFARRGVSLQA